MVIMSAISPTAFLANVQDLLPRAFAAAVACFGLSLFVLEPAGARALGLSPASTKAGAHYALAWLFGVQCVVLGTAVARELQLKNYNDEDETLAASARILIAHTLGYFLYDTLSLLIRKPIDDRLMLVHHAVTLYLAIFSAGMPGWLQVKGAIVLIYEITAPLLIHRRLITFARSRGAEGALLGTVETLNNIVFSLTFLTLRGPGMLYVAYSLTTTNLDRLLAAPWRTGEATIALWFAVTAMNLYWCRRVLHGVLKLLLGVDTKARKSE